MTTKNYQNLLVKSLKDQGFGVNIRQKVKGNSKTKIQQISIDTFSNQNW